MITVVINAHIHNYVRLCLYLNRTSYNYVNWMSYSSLISKSDAQLGVLISKLDVLYLNQDVLYLNGSLIINRMSYI